MNESNILFVLFSQLADLTPEISAIACYLPPSSFLFPVGVLCKHLLQDGHVHLQLLLLLSGQALHLLAKATIQLPPPGPLILQLLLLLPPLLQLLHLQLLLLDCHNGETIRSD